MFDGSSSIMDIIAICQQVQDFTIPAEVNVMSFLGLNELEKKNAINTGEED